MAAQWQETQPTPQVPQAVQNRSARVVRTLMEARKGSPERPPSLRRLFRRPLLREALAHVVLRVVVDGAQRRFCAVSFASSALSSRTASGHAVQGVRFVGYQVHA